MSSVLNECGRFDIILYISISIKYYERNDDIINMGSSIVILYFEILPNHFKNINVTITRMIEL